MFLLLVEMERLLDLVAQALALGGVCMATVLFLVHVTSATSLLSCQSCAPYGCCEIAYASVELILCISLVDFWDHVH